MPEKKKKTVTKKDVKAESGPPKKGGKVYVATSKGFYPYKVLKQAEKEEERPKSQQLSDESKKYVLENDLIEHPFETWGLMRLQDNCNVFDACVRQVASDVIGQGYELISKKQTDQNENGKKVLTSFLERVNDDNEGINDILEKAIIDLMTVGWYGIEVSRDNKMIDGMWHIPAHTIYAHRDGNKYCQVRDDAKTWFVKFNSGLKINKDTGKKESKGDANEIIFGGRYYAQSSSYGAPPILPAVGEVKSLIGIRDYNLSFFENYGIPAALVTLEGEWDEDACKQLSDFINAEIKGTDNAHKTAVIETPEGGKLTWEPLVIEKKEGSFHIYYKSQRDAVLISYRMPPYRIGLAEQGPVSKDTEVLTNKGWRLVKDVKIGEKVATLNLMTDRIEYQKTEKTFKYYYEKLVNFYTKDRTLDILTSSDHRIWARFGHNRKYKWHWYKAKELLEKSKKSENYFYYIRTAGIYEGTKNKISPELGGLIGWIISEGSPRYRKKQGYEISIHQKPGESSDKIKYLLDKLGYKYSKKTHKLKKFGYYPSGAPRKDTSMDCFRLLGKDKRKVGAIIKWEKRIPKEIFESSLDTRLRCLQTLIAGDGHISGKSRIYYTADKILADQVLTLASISGINARIKKRKRWHYNPQVGRKKTELYEVTIKQPQIQPQRTVKYVKEVEYNDYAYCLSVKNGTLLYRRKNQPFIAGNSLGGSTAKESTRIYNDSVVKPLELKFSKIMQEVIKGRGVDTLVLKFNPLDTRDMAELVDRWKILFGMGAINVNYIREQMGLDKAPHGDDYYILKSYIPVGEETMKQREETFDITMDEIHGKLDRILREKQIKLDDLQNLKEEMNE